MAQSESDSHTDKERIKEVILSAYIEGLQNEGDTTKIQAGFHPTFVMIGKSKEGQLIKRTIAEWQSRQLVKKENGELPLTGVNRISGKVDKVDITGDAAVARLQYYVGDVHRFRDYLSLYKFEDGWKIMVKTYQEL